MTQTTKQPPVGKAVVAEQASAQPNGFKNIALPAVAAAVRRKPQTRAERRVGLVLDPARYAD